MLLVDTPSKPETLTQCWSDTGPPSVAVGSAVPTLAVSSSPRPWINVFALREKFNMSVTESDLDRKVRKMSITF